jgi:hypothetical protein
MLSGGQSAGSSARGPLGHAGKVRPQPLQPPDAGVDLGDAGGEHAGDVGAGRLAPLSDLEHLPRLVEAEAHRLAGADEGEATDHDVVVVPVARGGPGWLGQQPVAFVEADRRAGDAGPAGGLADAHPSLWTS